MPYYLGKVPLRAELPELAEEVNAAKTSPQQAVGLRRRLCDGILFDHLITECTNDGL